MSRFKELPTQEYLQECFTYDPETGNLYWKHRPKSHFESDSIFKSWNTKYSGKLALNSLNDRGYKHGSLDNKRVKAHRVIYKLINNLEPEEILHFEGNTVDNKIENITGGNHSTNLKDQKKSKKNTSDITGVYWNESRQRWIAQIGKNGTTEYLSSFVDKNAAIDRRKQAELEYNFHPNHGKRS